jgi:phytoene dehydrogenase-like protein
MICALLLGRCRSRTGVSYTRNDRQNYDVVIVGGGVPAVVAGAVLANEGRSVAIVYEHQQIGGRYGSTNHNGYWLPWGHRDGDGFADIILVPTVTQLAAKRANVQLQMRPLLHYFSRVHLLPEPSQGQDVGGYWTWPIRHRAGAMESAKEMLRTVAPSLSAQELEPAADELVSLVTEIATMDTGESYRLVPVTVRDWLAGRNVSLPVQQTLAQLMEINAHIAPLENSVGRLADRIRALGVESADVRVPDNPNAGGMQGVIEPFLRRFKECGGEVWLGWKPLEVMLKHNLDGPEVTGVVALNQSNLVREFHAPVVITDYNGWRLPELVDRALLPRAFVERAEFARQLSANDFVGWAAGLKRLPRRVRDGKTEDTFFHRFLGGRSAGMGYVGGFIFMSELDGGVSAPPGKKLMYLWCQRAENAMRMRDGKDLQRSFPSWAAAREHVDQMLKRVWELYGDIDDCIDWSQYMYQEAPHGVIWRQNAPGYLHSIDVPTIEGLYVAGETAEDYHMPQDSEAAAALQAIELATLQRGHLWGKVGNQVT